MLSFANCCLHARQVLEDKASLALLQRLMTAPTLDSYVAKGRAEVTRWAQMHYQSHADAPPSPYIIEGAPHADSRPSPCLGEDERRDGHPEGGRRESARDEETRQQCAGVVTQTGGGGGAGGGGWWCVKAAGGNGGMDIWVLHEGNWRAVTQKLRDGEIYVIQVCAKALVGGGGGRAQLCLALVIWPLNTHRFLD